jgi:hypothetical protein
MRSIRADLQRFITAQGYEPVLFEKGHVPYGTQETLEEDCHREISTCDILINIVGGRFGTDSGDTRYSISQAELRTAVTLGKQVYVFVEKAVHSEYQTYLQNKEVKGFTPAAVNDLRVYKFLEEIFSLPGRNPICPFEIAEDITLFLREQWAGLFEMLLSEHSRQKEILVLEKLEASATTLNQMVTYLTEQRTEGDQTIRDILLSNHPFFAALQKALQIPYRVFFTNIDEMNALLNARKTEPVAPDEWDSPEFSEYVSNWFKKPRLLKIRASLFGEHGELRAIRPNEWADDNIQVAEIKREEDDDDVPF